ETIGVFTVYDRTGRVYAPAEIRVAQAFADHAALALEKARAWTDARESRELLAKLYQSAIGMRVSPDRAARVRAFMQAAVEILRFDRLWVALVTDDHALETVAAHGWTPPARLSLDAGAGPFHAAVTTGAPVVV